jgi:hypothetical protein
MPGYDPHYPHPSASQAAFENAADLGFFGGGIPLRTGQNTPELWWRFTRHRLGTVKTDPVAWVTHFLCAPTRCEETAYGSKMINRKGEGDCQIRRKAIICFVHSSNSLIDGHDVEPHVWNHLKAQRF